MSNGIGQRQDEREVFESFAGICPLGICLDSIRHQDPPNPDILCQDMDGNVIEFELGEAGDQNAQRYLNLAIEQTLVGMRDYYESLPNIKKREFFELYGDANLNFKFQEDATKAQRNNVYAAIFSFLLSLEPGYEGDVKNGTRNFPNICKRITITRGINGPFFYENFPSSSVSCVYETIKRKFEKSYETQGHLELLIHSYDCLLVGKSVWIEKIDEFLSENMQASQFERVWVFDFHGPSIEYVYPKLNAAL